MLVVLALEGCDGATDQESSVDAGPCAPDACVMPLCGWVMTGSGEICINGAAAHRAEIGHLVIIANYGLFSEDDLQGFAPRVALVDAKNRIAQLT